MKERAKPGDIVDILCPADMIHYRGLMNLVSDLVQQQQQARLTGDTTTDRAVSMNLFGIDHLCGDMVEALDMKRNTGENRIVHFESLTLEEYRDKFPDAPPPDEMAPINILSSVK